MLKISCKGQTLSWDHSKGFNLTKINKTVGQKLLLPSKLWELPQINGQYKNKW